ncbi:MAG: AtpZ/AtpI family protein [Lachnospiraceae bacterium]
MKYNRNVYRSLVMITQFGLNMLVPIMICTFVGNFMDKKLGTSFFVIIFFFVGALAGFRNVFIFAKKIYEDKESPDEKTKRHK